MIPYPGIVCHHIGNTAAALVSTLATDIAADGKHLVAHDKSYAQVLLPLRRPRPRRR